MKQKLNMWRIAASVVSGLWLTSLVLPVTPETKLYGIMVLAFGWSGLFQGQIGWLANLSLAWTVLLLVSSKVPSRKVALLAVFLIVGPLCSSFVWNGAGGMETQEAARHLTHGPGRYVWIVSLVLAASAIALRGFGGVKRRVLA